MPFCYARGVFAAIATTTALVLAGCASTEMKNYIGQPVESVIIDYGPPSAVLDLGWDQRAYQWRKISTNVVPGSTSGEIRDTRRGQRYQEYVTPGYVQEQECFYTFYARQQGGRWYVTNFRQPKLECE